MQNQLYNADFGRVNWAVMLEPLRYLLRQPGFQQSPGAVLARTGLWLFYCGVRHSPRFQLAEGVRFKVDPVLRRSGSASAFILRQWAEPELRYLDQLLPRCGGFIDCGANVGIYTARAAGIVGPHGKVIAVEPSTVSFKRLSTNVELNRFSQVILVNKAISDTEATARLYHADGAPVSFSLVPKSGSGFEEVETTTIDKLVKENRLERLDCIKLDVEGAEIFALRGAQETLSRLKPTVIFERSSAGQRRLATSEDVPGPLRSHGYQIYAFRGAPLSRTKYESPNLIALHPDSGKQIPQILRPWNP